MSLRVLEHILFWFVYVMFYTITDVLFASPSDLAYTVPMRFLRFLFQELSFLPWKLIPFYFLFYFLLPKYFSQRNYFKIALYFSFVLFFCLFGYRSVIAPLSKLLYGTLPEFNVYSLKRFIYSLGDIIPVMGLAATIKLLRGSIAAQQKEQQLQKEKLESELHFLKAQTNPHFLFNTLNNLYGLARKNSPNTAPSIMKLANIMRYILYECNDSSIAIEKEIEIIDSYIELEKLRYDERLKVSFEKNMDDSAQSIAPLILLPFVENAFKHGASENRFDTFIKIQLKLDKKQLQFNVTNTRSEETEVVAEGIGLKNIKRQLDLIYGKNYTLNVTPSPTIFSIDLLIYLHQHERSA